MKIDRRLAGDQDNEPQENMLLPTSSVMTTLLFAAGGAGATYYNNSTRGNVVTLATAGLLGLVSLGTDDPDIKHVTRYGALGLALGTAAGGGGRFLYERFSNPAPLPEHRAQGPADTLANLGMTNPWDAEPQTQWNVDPEAKRQKSADVLANLGMVNLWDAAPQTQWNVKP